MILTGLEIDSEVQKRRISITPFDSKYIEPNSYGFHLGSKLITYEDTVLDAGVKMKEREIEIKESGYCLQPGTFYLGSTLETMGSDCYAATLYANRSVSTLGMWIQFSAPLGHTGAIIPWTLEMRVSHPTNVYPGMLIGKIAFWQPDGMTTIYDGKYAHSTKVMSSLIISELIDCSKEREI